MSVSEQVELDVLLADRHHYDTPEGIAQIANGTYSTLSKFSYKPNKLVINAFFADPILSKAFRLARDQIRTTL